MKRLFKFLVAGVTSLCLLIANTPLTQVAVMADGVEYTLSNGFIEEQQRDTLELKQGDSFLSDNSLNILSPGKITLNYTGTDINSNIHVKEFVIYVDGNKVFNGTTGFYQINTRFIVDHYNINQADEAVLELSSVNTVTVKSNVVRTLNFKGNGLINGSTRGDPQLNVCIDQAEAETVTVTEYTMDFIGMPTEFSIENPGGMGVEKLGRLAEVIIDNDPQKVTARYDKCTYSFEGLDTGDFTIELYGDNTPGGVIEWTNCGCPYDQIQGNIRENNEQFENGSARVVGVYKTYEDIAAGKNIMSDYGIENNGALFDKYNGCLRIENGYWIAFEFTPLPGYQLVEFGGSAPGQEGIGIRTNDAPNVYYFQMPQGNCHFTAKFDTPDNIVKIKGNSIVDGGAIKVPANEFDGGTAQMSVADLNADTRSAYNNNADVKAQLDKNDLEIEEYLSLDLANIYQKANTDEYWEKDYHKLTEGDATVTLKVDDKFNPDNNKVYIVHDKGNGEGVETLEAEYNPNTHEITFETGSFSNFMIATSDEANDIEVKPNEPGQPGEPGGPEGPRYVIALDEKNELAIGHWEDGRDDPILVPLEIGEVVPGDALFELDIPDEFVKDPEDAKFPFVFFVGEVEKDRFSVAEPGAFSPGHYVIYKGLKVTDKAVEIYFEEAYTVAIEVMADCKVTVLDVNGKEIKPLNVPEEINYPKFELGDADEDTWTYFELVFDTEPSKVIIEGINNYAILALSINEKEDALETPIGANTIKYPAGEDDFIFIFVWGTEKKSDTITLSGSVTSSSVVYDGLSEDEYDDYVLVVAEFNMKEIPDEDMAEVKKYLAEKGYSDCVLPMGFNIDLYDKDGIVHEPGFAVRITLVLEKELDIDDGETVAILHAIDEETFEIIEAVYNAKNKTITFETKTFSPFVVFAGTKTAAAIVSTGETTNTTRIVIASVMIAAAAATGLFLIRKKEEEKENDSNPTT